MSQGISKSYFSKLGANFSSLFYNGISLLLIPRTLGPLNYGVFNFLTEYFNNYFIFASLGTDMAFFTALSSDSKNKKLIKYFILFTAITTFISIVIFTIIYHTSLVKYVFPDQSGKNIILAFIYSVLFYLFTKFRSYNDSIGFTAKTDKYIILQRILGLVILFGLLHKQLLTLETLFFQHFLILAIIIIVWLIFHLSQKDQIDKDNEKLNKSEFLKISKSIYEYSRPLFFYLLVSTTCIIADRYLLQIYGGGSQQGFYSFSYRLSTFIIMFTTAMTPIFTREFSMANRDNDKDKMKMLFEKYLPIFFLLSSFLSMYVIANGKSILHITAGNDFDDGLYSFVLMSLYPIHQTFGQLNGSAFYATHRTKQYANIGIVFSLIGMLITYLILKDTRINSVINSSTGLSIKMVLINLISVNTLLWYNSKFLNLKFWKLIFDQVKVILSTGFLIFGINFLLKQVFTSTILILLFGGAIYFIMVCLLVLFSPSLFGMDKSSSSLLSQYIFRKRMQ